MPIYFGNREITTGNLKLGSTDVKEVFVGSERIWPPGEPPSAPTQLYNRPTARDVYLWWGGATGEITGYDVERTLEDDETFVRLATNQPDTWHDSTGHTEGERYIYQVRAVGPGGNSDWIKTDAVEIPRSRSQSQGVFRRGNPEIVFDDRLPPLSKS